MSAVALHEAEIRAHVARSLEHLDECKREHDAMFGDGGSPACRYCQLWALSYAQIRRVLDFLEVEIPKR